MDRMIRVPLAVDAQVRLPAGPVLLPVRSLVLMLAVSPLVLLLIQLNVGDPNARIFGAVFLIGAAMAISAPTREGIWMGTYFLWRAGHRVMPSLIKEGVPRRARVRRVGGALTISGERGLAVLPKTKLLGRLQMVRTIPRAQVVQPGILRLTPGGFRGVLLVEGPTNATSSPEYVRWCTQFTSWLTGIECPAQFLTVMTHFDAQRAQAAFDRRISPEWPRTMFLDEERRLAGLVAEKSMGLRHYVILAPGTAAPDGVPYLNKFKQLTQPPDTTRDQVDRSMGTAQRLASSFGIELSLPDKDELASVLSHSVMGTRSAAAGDDGALEIGGEHTVLLTATKLPARIEAGVVVEALMRAQCRGSASLHIIPSDPAVARNLITKQNKLHKYSARKGNDDVDTQVAIADNTQVLAAIAQRTVVPCRFALTMSVNHPSFEKAAEAAERLFGIMRGAGFTMQKVTTPGFLPALAVSPGGLPLARSVQLTTDGVIARMLPALGTPFFNFSQPLIAVNAHTGAPSYLSVWTRPNHNCVIVGSSGAGKSVATKTFLIRHAMEGATSVIIDPDSEYRETLMAVRGSYVELGQDALNPLAAAINEAPDVGASLIMPVLSVMGGDEKGIRDGRPIRRLSDEDQGWMHTELAGFFRDWRELRGTIEPVLHDLIDYLTRVSMPRGVTERQRDRCQVIAARLSRYTQGQKAAIFDRPSSFTVGERSVGIGLRTLALSYAADLTPALAIVLTNTLAAIGKVNRRMIVVVDEAHRVTSDPDAGEVLGQLVRQARKYGCGVWMCSQKVEDFVETDLGRTLAATASTKLILGVEEASLEGVRDVFKLRPQEVAALNPIAAGRGVLISGVERAVVRILPGPAIMALANTTPTMTAAARVSPPSTNGRRPPSATPLRLGR